MSIIYQEIALEVDHKGNKTWMDSSVQERNVRFLGSHATQITSESIYTRNLEGNRLVHPVWLEADRQDFPKHLFIPFYILAIEITASRYVGGKNDNVTTVNSSSTTLFCLRSDFL